MVQFVETKSATISALLRGKDGTTMAFLKSRAARKQSVCVLLSLFFVGLALPSEAKKLSFDLPSSDKLTDGDTPQSTIKSTAPAGDTAEAAQPAVPLTPLGLHDDEKANQAAAASDSTDGGSGDQVLKSTVSQTDFKGKSKAGSGDKNEVASGKEESVIDKKNLSQKVLKDKKGKNLPAGPSVEPLALQSPKVDLVEGDDETKAKVDATLDAEQHQMSELWQSTIDRNPDIQFVIQKLQPNSDANHAMASTMKFLTATLCGAMNMAPFMLPGGVSGSNPAAMMGMGSGSSLIQGLFQDKATKGLKKQAVSQEQATILYKIVRDTADKLVVSYRDYKKEQVSVDRASTDLADLKSMVAESRQGQDPAKQLDMEYTLRKAKRDIDEKVEQTRLYRQQLTDLAGPDAIAKLDKQLVEEKGAIDMLTAGGTPVTDPAVKPADKGAGPFVNPLALPQLSAPASAIPH